MIPEWIITILLTFFAGAAIPAGALIARHEHIRPHWLERELKHSIIAFGGGILLSAVALVLVPEGIKHLSILEVSLCFIFGGLAFMAIDIAGARMKGSASQLIAMLADFLPEAIALGATLVNDFRAGLLLAVVISLQNLPEGFNAFRELRKTRLKANHIIGMFWALSLLGPVCGILGFFLLNDMPEIVGSIMVFAAGGILYLTMQDIAPQAVLKKHWAPPLGAVLGFLSGIIAHMIIS